MTPNIAKRLALVFPTAALQEAGVTGVAGVADVTRYAKKPLEPRQLRPLRQENDNAGKVPDKGVVTDVAAPVAPEKSGVFALLRIGRDSWSGEDWRAFFDERAGIAEFDGGLREQAEALAFTCCVAGWLNRSPVRSSPDSCLRCGDAKHAHAPLLPFGTSSTGRAWLHSHCWSPWYAARQAEAVAAAEATGIATPGFPNDFDKNGGCDGGLRIGTAGRSRQGGRLPFNRREPAASQGLPARRLNGQLPMVERRRQGHPDQYACRA